jgi:hypothetical protein
LYFRLLGSALEVLDGAFVNTGSNEKVIVLTFSSGHIGIWSKAFKF